MAGVSSFSAARRRAHALTSSTGQDESAFNLAWAILLANALGNDQRYPPLTAWLTSTDAELSRARHAASEQLPVRLRTEIPSIDALRSVVDTCCTPFHVHDTGGDEWDISFTEGHPLRPGVQWAAPQPTVDLSAPIDPQPGDLLLYNGHSPLASVLADMGHSVINMTPQFLRLLGTDSPPSAVRWYPFVDGREHANDLALIATKYGEWHAVQLF